MIWSWTVGQLFGIPVYIHTTFLLLLGFILLVQWREGGNLVAAIGGVLFILAIFATIVLHELGHALTARRFGIRTMDITLLPIGGIACLERMPDVPRYELYVALAGPAVNLAIAAIVFSISALAGMGASGASLAVQTRAVLAGIPVAQAMMTDFRTLGAGGRCSRSGPCIPAAMKP